MKFQIWFSDGNDRWCEAQIESPDMERTVEYVRSQMVKPKVLGDIEEDGDDECVFLEYAYPTDDSEDAIIESFQILKVDKFTPTPFNIEG